MTDWAAKVLDGVPEDAFAKIVYEAMRFERKDETPEWTDRGNSAAQTEARSAAAKIQADALAAIASMGAGDGLVERATAALEGVTGDAWRINRVASLNVETTDGRSVASCGGYGNNQRIEAVSRENATNARFIAFTRQWVPEAAAHIAALTAQNREMALDVLASSGQAADAYAAQLAAEAERDALRAQMAENRISEPHDPGDFVGDIYYGHPIKTTMGTHRWTGTEWVVLPSEAEALAGLLADARKEADALAAILRMGAGDGLRERVARLEGALRWIIENNDEGNGLYSRDGLYAKRARAAITDGGKDG